MKIEPLRDPFNRPIKTDGESILNDVWPFMRQILRNNGRAYPVIFVGTPDGVVIINIEESFLENDRGKAALVSLVRSLLAERHGVSVVFISETWTAPLSDVERGILRAGGIIPRPQARAGASEGVMVSVQEPGRRLFGVSAITRDPEGLADTSQSPPKLFAHETKMRFFD